jgi:suppressor of ftsI
MAAKAMQVFSPDRRSLLRTFGSLAQGIAAAGFVRAAISAPSAVLLKTSRAFAASKEPLIQPSGINSQDGVLSTTLTAAPRHVQLSDFSFDGFLYNEKYIPALLRVGLGDSLRITFRNDLPDSPSNLHFHGMSVSPQGNGDNVFIHVHPGQQFQYEVRIPSTGRQGPGLFWYHPHAHGFVEKQILGGMSGGLIVDGSDQLYPILRGLQERFLFIKHIETGTDSELISINGQINPAVEIRPGEMQFWRIGHIGASLFIKFRVEGMPLYVVARDGHPLTQPQKVSEFFVGPGERIEAIAVGPEPGEYAMMTIPFQDQVWRKPFPAQQLATVISSGSRVSRVDEAEILHQRVQGNAWIDEVRAAPIAHRRTLTYSRTPDRKVFMIDGRIMEENRVDQVVHLGDTEEWTIVNTDQQYHSFHIHQTGFLVTEVNGVSQNGLGLRDTFSLPPDTDGGHGVVKVVIPFTDPVIVGRFVYHCHAVDHEDKGMMGVIEVVG